MRHNCSWLEKKILCKEDRGIVFTCAVNFIPRIPWLAGAHKGSISVLAISVCSTVVLSCFTLIYNCEKRSQALNDQNWFPFSFTAITVAYHNIHSMGSIFIFKTRSILKPFSLSFKINFHIKRLRTSPSFKTEARVNSKMAKIAYRYCKSQTIAVCKGISILIIKCERTNCSSRD